VHYKPRYLSVSARPAKKKHILIKSPQHEYGSGKASVKKPIYHKVNLKFPPESSTWETTQDDEFTWADFNKPNGNHSNRVLGVA